MTLDQLKNYAHITFDYAQANIELFAVGFVLIAAVYFLRKKPDTKKVKK